MSKSVEELIEDLNDQDEFVVEAAAGELEMMGKESVDALMSALSIGRKYSFKCSKNFRSHL